MAERQVFCEESPIETSLLPAQIPAQRILEAPMHPAGSFLVEAQPSPAMRLLTMTLDKSWDFSFAPEPSYESYLRMDKRFVNQREVPTLLDVYESLRDQCMPRYLSAAGCAAAEAGLMATQYPERKRLDLLEGAVDCWQRSLINERKIQERAGIRIDESTQPVRSALKIATAPLLAGVVQGDLTSDTLHAVFEDCLAIAQHNEAVRIDAKYRGDTLTASDHFGLSHEINVMLVINRELDPGRFATPVFMRSDTGYYLRDQTHDLSVIHQRWGTIKNVTPVEVKRRKSSGDRARYDALIIDNHDLTRGQLSVGETLQAVVYAHENPENDEGHAAEIMTEQVKTLITEYDASRELRPAKTNSVTRFRDAAPARSHHPGFMPKVVARLRHLTES